MYKRHIIGKIGEDIAESYLIKNNYEIIERNFSCRQGEIDIIAKYKNEIIFIEVKTRSNNKYGNPIDAVTYFKKNHMLKSIQYYLFSKKLEDCFIRIDIIEVYKKGDRFFINHIKNAINI